MAAKRTPALLAPLCLPASPCLNNPAPLPTHPSCFELLDCKQLLLVVLCCRQVHHAIGALPNLAQQIVVLLQTPAASLPACSRCCCCWWVVWRRLLLLLRCLLVLGLLLLVVLLGSPLVLHDRCAACAPGLASCTKADPTTTLLWVHPSMKGQWPAERAQRQWGT